MKTFIALVSLLVSVRLIGDEVRIVNNKDVNLAPVVKWFKYPDGERPMKHWKKIQFQSRSVLGTAAGGIRCSVEIEGDTKDIILANPPHFVLRLIQESSASVKRMAQIEASVEILERKARALDQQAQLASPDDISIVLANRTAVRNQITALEIEYGKVRDALKLTGDSKNWYEFAMFTGRKVGKLEIWDCGRRKPN